MPDRRKNLFLDLPVDLRFKVLRQHLLKSSRGEDGQEEEDPTIEIPPPGRLARARPVGSASNVTTRPKPSPSRDVHANVLLTCRRARSEGLPLLYQENSFQINEDDVAMESRGFLPTIGTANVARLRRLILDHRHGGHNRTRVKDWQAYSKVENGATVGTVQDTLTATMFHAHPRLNPHVFALGLGIHSEHFGYGAPDTEFMHAREAVLSAAEREMGVADELDLAVNTGNADAVEAITEEMHRHLYYWAALGATLSLRQARPELTAHIYYGCYEHDAYAIFSREPLQLDPCVNWDRTLRLDDPYPQYKLHVDLAELTVDDGAHVHKYGPRLVPD